MGFPFAPIFSSEEGFKRYLAWAKPDLLIMPKSVSYTPDQLEFNVWMVFQELGGNRDVLRIESANYIALDISAVFRNWVPVRSMTSKMGRMEQCAAGS
jgi:hypothetical protein